MNNEPDQPQSPVAHSSSAPGGGYQIRLTNRVIDWLEPRWTEIYRISVVALLAYIAFKPIHVERVESIQPIAVASLPSVRVSSLPSADIRSLPPVSVSHLPSVNVDTLPLVSVHSLPGIEVNSVPPVTVRKLPDFIQVWTK
jgi:hypothetical protein